MSAADNMKCDICENNHHPMTECRDALRSLASASGSVALELNEREKLALDELCNSKEMTPQGVMLAALRLYQAVALGAADVTWKSTGPIGCMGDDCPPNVKVMASLPAGENSETGGEA
jgi:hypothetical protein